MLIPPEESLSSLLGSLYDAAANPELWNVFLHRLGDTVKAHCADMLMHDTRDQSHTISRYWRVDPETVRLYHEHYGSKDVWVSGASAAPMGWTGTSDDLCAPSEFSKSEFYNDFLLRHGNARHAMFGIIKKGEYGFSNVSLFRSPSAQPFGPDELQLLQFLVPHIQRAYLLHFKISEIKSHNQSLQSAFDLVPTAMVLLDSTGRILAINQAAARLTLANDGLLATLTGLSAERCNESARLRQLITQAIATSAGKGLGPAGAVSISRSNGVPLQVVVTPIGNRVFDMTSAVRAIVFINDPSQRNDPAENVLKMLFRLTPAECRLAQLMGDGNSPTEISELLSVSGNTLKSQLASIYQKTNTCRQSQLVRLLSQLALTGKRVSPRQR